MTFNLKMYFQVRKELKHHIKKEGEEFSGKRDTSEVGENNWNGRG
jgi:hypothetical protein